MRTLLGFLLILSSVLAAQGKSVDAQVFESIHAFDSSIQKNGYSYKNVLLSDKSECQSAIVFLNGSSGYCGTGGCTILVLACLKNNYKMIGNTSVSMPPIYVSKESTKGYRNIKVYAKNKGQVVLKYNGVKYPENASMEPKSKVSSSDTLIFKEEDLFGK